MERPKNTKYKLLLSYTWNERPKFVQGKWRFTGTRKGNNNDDVDDDDGNIRNKH